MDSLFSFCICTMLPRECRSKLSAETYLPLPRPQVREQNGPPLSLGEYMCGVQEPQIFSSISLLFIRWRRILSSLCVFASGQHILGKAFLPPAMSCCMNSYLDLLAGGHFVHCLTFGSAGSAGKPTIFDSCGMLFFCHDCIGTLSILGHV